MNYTPIGRVRPIHKGKFDSAADYETLDVVSSTDGFASYMAKKNVPAGTALEDGEYWGLISEAKSDVVQYGAAQGLDKDQQAQARENIDAASADDVTQIKGDLEHVDKYIYTAQQYDWENISGTETEIEINRLYFDAAKSIVSEDGIVKKISFLSKSSEGGTAYLFVFKNQKSAYDNRTALTVSEKYDLKNPTVELLESGLYQHTYSCNVVVATNDIVTMKSNTAKMVYITTSASNERKCYSYTNSNEIVVGTTISVYPMNTLVFTQSFELLIDKIDNIVSELDKCEKKVVYTENLNKDRTTFTGALNATFEQLIKRNPTKKIIICTPLKCGTYTVNGDNGLTFLQKNPTTGKTMQEYVNRIKECAEIYSLDVIDLFAISGMNPLIDESIDAYYGGVSSQDHLHPRVDGHSRIANVMMGELNKKLPITSNGSDWNGKKILFIGDSITNKSNTSKGYFEFLQDWMGIISDVNAVSGSGYTITTPTNYPFYQRVIHIETTADAIVLFGGVNDFAFGSSQFGDIYI